MLTETFFKGVRDTLFGGNIPQSAVNTMNAIAAECERRNLKLDYAAYFMATAYREVGAHMLPIEEDRGLRAKGFYGQNKGARSDRTLSTIAPYNNQYYYGRGLVQLTWLDNYNQLGKDINQDLATFPDLALRADIALQVMVVGMLLGRFGHKLGEYITDTKTDFVGARHSVNGVDNATQIANNARIFLKGLQDNAADPRSKTPAVATATKPINTVVTAQAKPGGLTGWLDKWFGKKG